MLTEKILTEKLREKLLPQFENIWTNRKISASIVFRKHIETKLGYVPILQPEFDMVFKCHNGDLNAIEVKYLRISKNGYNISYYLGLGQTLALQRFGFDHVGLWLFVDENVNENILHKYGSEAWGYIRDEVSLGIEYSYFKIQRVNNDIKFLVMDFNVPHSGFKLIEINDPHFFITWKRSNPLKSNKKAILLRKAIELYLEGKLKN